MSRYDLTWGKAEVGRGGVVVVDVEQQQPWSEEESRQKLVVLKTICWKHPIVKWACGGRWGWSARGESDGNTLDGCWELLRLMVNLEVGEIE